MLNALHSANKPEPPCGKAPQGGGRARTVLRGPGAGLLLHPSWLATRLRPCLACRRVALEALALPPWAASPPQAS